MFLLQWIKDIFLVLNNFMIQKSTKKSYLVFNKENIKMKSVQSTVAQYYRLHSYSVFCYSKSVQI